MLSARTTDYSAAFFGSFLLGGHRRISSSTVSPLLYVTRRNLATENCALTVTCFTLFASATYFSSLETIIGSTQFSTRS